MKRFLCFLIATAIMVLSCGCTTKSTASEDSVKFYYLSPRISFNNNNGFIGQEGWNIGGLAPQKMLEVYLKGPQSELLVSPFPQGITVVDFSSDGTSAFVTLSADFSQLSGFQLTSACACLTLTLCEFTGVSSVTIQAEDSLLDGKTGITMSRDQIQLVDSMEPTDAQE